MTLTLGYGQPSAVVSWKVTISSQGAGTQKTFSGDRSNLPASIIWDGTTDTGTASPEGIYTATLAVDYGTAFTSGTATSPSFVLDITPPSGTISLSSDLFSPIESSDTISLKLTASSKLAKIDSWTMDIYDPGGNIFRSYTMKWPSDTAVWDGKNAGGEMVQSAEDYPVVAKIRDQFGNVGTVKAMVPIDILVEKRGTGYRILASRIFFKAFTADYKDVPAELARQNMARLDALTAKLKKFTGYKISIVGHAVMINWDKPAAGQEEQRTILIPLSKARAEAVKAALVERGLDVSRFATDGVGASDQLVPDSDYKDRWQNRRVALFLEKE
jgi:outer membrane protein OmpA-like peptidoglycan-associated protein